MADDSEEVTSRLRVIVNAPSVEYFTRPFATTPLPQSPPDIVPWSCFRPWTDVLSFANRERSMQLQKELLEEWSNVFYSATSGGITLQQPLQQLQYWIQVFNFAAKATAIMINEWEQGNQGLHGLWVAKTRVRPKRLKKAKQPCIGDGVDIAEEAARPNEEKCRIKGEKQQKRPCISGTFDTAREAAAHDGAKLRMKGEKQPKEPKRPCIGGTFDTAGKAAAQDEDEYRMRGEKSRASRLNFPKLFLKIVDPYLIAGNLELTQQLLQEWRNNVFIVFRRGIFKPLHFWSYALNFAARGLYSTLNDLRPIKNTREHSSGEWVVKIRFWRSKQGGGDLDVIKLKGEKSRLNFPILFLTECEKGKGISKNPSVRIEIPLEHILQYQDMRKKDAAKSLKGK